MIAEEPILKEIAAEKEVLWLNPLMKPAHEGNKRQELTMRDIEDAGQRLIRFAPLIMKCFPETKEKGGLIESALIPIPQMQRRLDEKYQANLAGKLLLKQDSHLAIAGSIKARGGIYEVLKHTEELALKHGLISEGESYEKLASEESRAFFSKYSIQVGSTGNLGMSIGIMSAALGYHAVVHMSADAKQWKKELLRTHGVTVVEYEADYSAAVIEGRKLSDEDPNSYFVDDENSRDLFLGYAVAAKRLEMQLKEQEIAVDEEHPLFVYLPCGVGGAPGGITFGLKQIFGDCVHCFFVEPVQAPCMLLGMATGRHSDIAVQDVGLTGMTDADGLAVGRPSGFVGKVMEPYLSGIFTIKDGYLYDFMRDLLETQDIFLEPSACASFAGVVRFGVCDVLQTYIKQQGVQNKMANAVHIAWATGGSLVPEEVREAYKNTYVTEVNQN